MVRPLFCGRVNTHDPCGGWGGGGGGGGGACSIWINLLMIECVTQRQRERDRRESSIITDYRDCYDHFVWLIYRFQLSAFPSRLPRSSKQWKWISINIVIDIHFSTFFLQEHDMENSEHSIDRLFDNHESFLITEKDDWMMAASYSIPDSRLVSFWLDFSENETTFFI